MTSLYVGTYAKYNNGSIAGKWLDLEDFVGKDDFYKACKKLHSDESDPEFMFQDYEDLPESLYDESGGIDRIYEYLDLDSYDREIVTAYLEHEHSDDFQSVIDSFYGVYEDLEDFAYQFVNDCYQVPEWCANYIDYERMGKKMSYDFTECWHDGKLWLFR